MFDCGDNGLLAAHLKHATSDSALDVVNGRKAIIGMGGGVDYIEVAKRYLWPLVNRKFLKEEDCFMTRHQQAQMDCQ